MKKLFAVGPKKCELREVDMPVMNDDSIMIKIKYVGVCHSEHDDWADKGGAFGHEPVGVVVEVG